MINIIVMGHGGYAQGVKNNLSMLLGEPKNMYFLDLMRDDSLGDLENKMNSLISELGESDILFVCDLLGASPFRLAAIYSATNPEKAITVTGLNTMAFLELSMSMDLNLFDLADRVIETTKASVSKFPDPTHA